MTEKFRNILKGSMLIFRISYIPGIPQIHYMSIESKCWLFTNGIFNIIGYQIDIIYKIIYSNIVVFVVGLCSVIGCIVLATEYSTSELSWGFYLSVTAGCYIILLVCKVVLYSLRSILPPNCPGDSIYPSRLVVM